jgi:DivIVA domain-containing protein
MMWLPVATHSSAGSVRLPRSPSSLGADRALEAAVFLTPFAASWYCEVSPDSGAGRSLVRPDSGARDPDARQRRARSQRVVRRRSQRTSALVGRENIHSMEWLIAVVAVAALGVAAMAAAGGMGQMSKDPVYDTYRQDLPTGGALTAEELRSVRFGITLRGYAMAQVDDLLDRLALEIAERDALIAELAEGAIVSQRLLESTASARAAEQAGTQDSPGSPGLATPPDAPPPACEDDRSGH